MKDAQNDDPDFQRSIKAATRAFEGIADLKDPGLCPTKKTCASDGGRKYKTRSGNSCYIISVVCWCKGNTKRPLAKDTFQVESEAVIQRMVDSKPNKTRKPTQIWE